MTSLSLAMGSPKSGPMGVYIKSQFLTKPQSAPPGTDLAGRVAIITGASSGLGFHACRHLLSLGLSRLVMAVRSPQKGSAAASTLRAEYPAATIDVWPLEMSSYDFILSFVRRVESADELPRLDIAILNAAVIKTEFAIVPATGHETTIQVNYLSTALLAILLLPSLRSKSPPNSPGRLTIVNSTAAYALTLPNRSAVPFLSSFDDQTKTPYLFFDRYCTSKLLMHMFLVRLATHVDPEDVVVNIVDPGYCKGSGLHRETKGIVACGFAAAKTLTGRSTEEGAWTYVDAAVVKGGESHGCFVIDWKIGSFAKFVYEPDAGLVIDRLWQETIAELEFAKVANILGLNKKDGGETS
ncbi:hypothetical protein GE09DRAFT_492408 [Coniochaeta sp. 2T2.1]|nr:hypothetical protein GE09DRAFT_492408 [Coniochaeta sp. 2T2.1]